MRQRQATPAPVAPARPVIPTVAPRLSGTTSAAYNPLSSANTGRPAPQPCPRGYNYTESDTASGQPAHMRRQGDRPGTDGSTGRSPRQRPAPAGAQQAQQTARPCAGTELPALTDPPADGGPCGGLVESDNAVRLTGRPRAPDIPSAAAAIVQPAALWPGNVVDESRACPRHFARVMQYIADRDLARTTRRRCVRSQLLAAGRGGTGTAAEAERFAAMGLPTTYKCPGEEELRAMASRPDRFNPILR